jgi:hypothetical protein
MLTESETNLGPAGERGSRLPFVSAALFVAVAGLGGILYTRGSSAPAPSAAQPASAERNAATVAYYGNGQLKVLSFYANPVEVKRGARALVCYGVSNASTVSIEPAIGETWPSTSRCLEVTAARNAEYKLTATDASGHQETRTAALHVSP